MTPIHVPSLKLPRFLFVSGRWDSNFKNDKRSFQTHRVPLPPYSFLLAVMDAFIFFE